MNLWKCFHDPRSSSRSKVMVIVVIRLQFHFSSPPLQFYWVTTHITLCTVTYHHTCNMVMIKAILCAAILSLCYTATCYGIDECITSCWCMGVSKYKDSTLHIKPNEHRSSGGGLRIVGANLLSWMPITTQSKYCTAPMRSAWIAPISPNTMFKSWIDTLQESVQRWYIPLPDKYDIISEPMR